MGPGVASGVAYPLWRRIEDERLSRGWTKTQLAERSGLSRSTYNDLQRTSRAPLPRIVHAFADAVGLDRTEAEQLAGLRPRTAGQAVGVREAIQASELLTKSNKRTIIELYEQLSEANAAKMASDERRTLSEVDRSDDERHAI
jgi:transcriptional regulator with XRE-family HTH domain